MNQATTNNAGGQSRLMIEAMVDWGKPAACPTSSKTRQGEGSVTSFSPPNSGLSALIP